jgi:hypothetical protein
MIRYWLSTTRWCFWTTQAKVTVPEESLCQTHCLLHTIVVLDEAGKTAFQKYLDLGGNFIGIHSASDCLRNKTFYGNETGD